MLRRTIFLRSLRVGNNSLGAVGIVDVCEALRINSTLTSLEVMGNEVDTKGAARLAYVMIRNPRLKEWCVRERVRVCVECLLDLSDAHVGESIDADVCSHLMCVCVWPSPQHYRPA